MADISQIKLPSGDVYNIKDAVARAAIEAITGGDAVVLIGVSSTAITDGGSQTPTISGWSGPLASGNLVFYGAQEYIYGKDSKWHALGDLSTLGALAQKSSATGSASYQPAGTVGQPTFTGTTATVTVSKSYQPAGTISTPSFTGSASDVDITVTADANGNYQPAGTISTPGFTGTTATITSTVSYQPAGSVSVSTNGTSNKTATVSTTTGTAPYTPGGSVGAPTISLKTAGTTASIKNPTAKTVMTDLAVTAPTATPPTNGLSVATVDGEILEINWLSSTKDSSISTSNVTVKTGDAAYEATAPSFTGTGVRLITGSIAVPNTYTATFTGTTATISPTASYQPAGSVSAPTFTGTKVEISGETTASGTVGKPTFTGTTATITSTGSYQPAGTVSAPSFTGTTATITITAS